MIKESMHQEDTMTINMYAPYNRTLPPQKRNTKQKLTKLQGEIYNSTIIVKDFNIPLTIMDRTTRQTTNNDIDKLNTINYLNLVDIHRTLHPSVAAYIIFSRACRTFSRIDHMLSDKTNLNKIKRIEIIQVCSPTTMKLN